MARTLINSSYRAHASNGFIGPVEDGNGNLYLVGLNTGAGNSMTVWKSADGGSSWTEQDTGNRPTALPAAVLNWSIRLNGTTIHIAARTATYSSGMNTVFALWYFTFNTSDAGASPDTHQIEEQIGEWASFAGAITATDIALRSDGDVIVVGPGPAFISMGTNWANVAIHRRESGSWTSTYVTGSGATVNHTDAAACVIGSSDSCHIFYARVSAHAITFDSANALSSEIQWTSNPASVRGRPVSWNDGSAQRVMVSALISSEAFTVRLTEDGSGDIATAGSDGGEVNDTAASAQSCSNLSIDTATEVVYLTWEDGTSGDLLGDSSQDGLNANWGTDQSVDTDATAGVNNLWTGWVGPQVGVVQRDGTSVYYTAWSPGGGGGGETKSVAGAITPSGSVAFQVNDGAPLVTNFTDYLSAFAPPRVQILHAIGSDLYAVGVDFDSVNNNFRPTIIYSIDDGETWSRTNASVGTDTYQISAASYDPDSNRIHILAVNETDNSVEYFAYNPTTKTFTVTAEAIVTHTGTQEGAIEGRSDGTVVALIHEDGSSPVAWQMWIRSSGGTWSGPTSFSADDGIDQMRSPRIAKGASDRLHIFHQNDTDNTWHHRTLTSANVLQTEQTIVTGANGLISAMQAAHLNSSGEIGLVYMKTDEVWEIVRANSADVPAWGAEETVADGAVPVEASGNSYMLPWCISPTGEWFFGLQYGGNLRILYDRDSTGWGTDENTGIDAQTPWNNSTGTVSRGAFVVRQGTDGEEYLGWLMVVPDLDQDAFASYQQALIGAIRVNTAGSIAPTGALTTEVIVPAETVAIAGALAPSGSLAVQLVEPNPDPLDASTAMSVTVVLADGANIVPPTPIQGLGTVRRGDHRTRIFRPSRPVRRR